MHFQNPTMSSEKVNLGSKHTLDLGKDDLRQLGMNRHLQFFEVESQYQHLQL